MCELTHRFLRHFRRGYFNNRNMLLAVCNMLSGRDWVVSLCLGCLLASPFVVHGHGSVGDPVSRVYRIFLENPQSPVRPVSADAIAVAGTQAFYDWSEVNRLAPNYADGDMEAYRALIPDGQLASAGRAKYGGLDLLRSDWPATPVNAGSYPVVFDAHVPHDPSYFKAFISRSGWDPEQILRWDDLEVLTGPENFVRDGALYRFSVDFPERIGHHVLFVIWQRLDPAGEVFFSLSDIDFGDGSGFGNPDNGSGTYDAFPIDYLTDEIDAAVDFTIQNDWGSGFTAEFTINNQGPSLINGWSFEFELDRNITSLWNAQLIRREGSRYTVKNDGWNSSIAGGSSTSFGFQADPGGVDLGDLGLVQINGVTIQEGDGSEEDPEIYPPVDLPQIEFSDLSIVEGDAGQQSACVTIRLSSVASEMVHLMVDTLDETAVAGDDYLALSRMVHFAPGQLETDLCIEILGDLLVEGDESFALVWSGAVGATLVGTRSTITIADNDVTVPIDENDGDNEDAAAVTWVIDDDWGSGYTATVVVRNDSETPIDSWVVSFDLDVPLVNYWNTESFTQEGSRMTFRNASWNGEISPGGSVSFGIQAASSADITPTNISLNGSNLDSGGSGLGDSNDAPEDDGAQAGPGAPHPADAMRVFVRDAWGQGFTADASIVVPNGVDGWELSFDFPFSISQIWNAFVVEQVDGRYTIQDAGYNAHVSPGAEILFGFGASGGGLVTGETLVPGNVSLNGVPR